MAHRMAKCIRVVNTYDRGLVMEIDGEEFPFFTKDGYHLDVRRTDSAGVTLTIIAERVEVEDAALERRPGQSEWGFTVPPDAVQMVRADETPLVLTPVSDGAQV